MSKCRSDTCFFSSRARRDAIQINIPAAARILWVAYRIKLIQYWYLKEGGSKHKKDIEKLISLAMDEKREEKDKFYAVIKQLSLDWDFGKIDCSSPTHEGLLAKLDQSMMGTPLSAELCKKHRFLKLIRSLLQDVADLCIKQNITHEAISDMPFYQEKLASRNKNDYKDDTNVQENLANLELLKGNVSNIEKIYNLYSTPTFSYKSIFARIIDDHEQFIKEGIITPQQAFYLVIKTFERVIEDIIKKNMVVYPEKNLLVAKGDSAMLKILKEMIEAENKKLSGEKSPVQNSSLGNKK